MLTEVLFLYTLSLTVIYYGYKRSLMLFGDMANKRFLDLIKLKILEWKQYFWQKKKEKGINDVPGPVSVPLLGTKWIYFWRYKMNKIHEAYADLQKRYGPIVAERTSSGIPFLSIYDRDDLEKILKYPSKVPFRPPTEIISYYRKTRPDRYCSVGITNAQGEEWQELRTKLTHTLMSRRCLYAFLPTLNEICDDFIQLIKEKRDPKTKFVMHFEELANLMSLETVCCLILGKRVGYLTGDIEKSEFTVLAASIKRLFVLIRDAYFGNGLWKHFPTKMFKEFAKTEETIYDIISEIVEETLKAGDLECETEDIRNIYLSILQSDLDIRDKKSAIIDFITSGIELLAHTLSFLFYYLTKDITYQNRIYEEYARCQTHITKEDLSEAHFTKACIQESYRLCPTAFGIARILEEDCNLSGYNIKAGTFVLCQTMIACHDEKNFTNATKFVPQRWLDCSKNQCCMSLTAAGPGSNLVLPFGIGKRTCPGKRYIEMELSLVVARILREFTIEYEGELEVNFEFILAPRTPVNIRFIDRD